MAETAVRRGAALPAIDGVLEIGTPARAWLSTKANLTPARSSWSDAAARAASS